MVRKMDTTDQGEREREREWVGETKDTLNQTEFETTNMGT